MRPAREIQIFWAVEQFLAKAFPGQEHLGPLATVTGDGCNAIYETCARYLQWQWPETGMLTLHIVESVLWDVDGRFG